MAETRETLKKYLEAFNWDDIVKYGEVRVKIREGKLKLITVEESTKID